MLGLGLTAHKRSVIFRRAYVDVRGLSERLIEIAGTRDGWNGHDLIYRREARMIEFGALEKPGAENTWQGRPHDFIGFDEGAQLTAQKVSFVSGWLRSSDVGQRCRIVIASNPPVGGDGEWLMTWFAPWLDPLFPEPAKPGELRWCITVGDETRWVEGPGSTEIEGEVYTHQSRSFIPAFLDDNPYLRDTGYRAQIQNLPEPLRSQLLKGDFLAGRKDHEWQVIPTEWVTLAEERWKAAEQKRRPMLSLALDPAGGGADDSALAALHSDAWFAPVQVKKSGQFENPATMPAELAAWMLQARKDGAHLSIDLSGGYGSGVRSYLLTNHQIEASSIIFGAGTERKSKDKKFGFKNLRAEMYWRFREALDPEEGDDVMLPPDPRLKAELTAARWKPAGTDIQIEDKAQIKQRVGSSPDRADAVVMAWHKRLASVSRVKAKIPAPAVAGGWMGR